MKFWKWVRNEADPELEPEIQETRTLFLNGTIAEETWFDDEVSPKQFKDELMEDDGDIAIWINSPGGDCFAAAQIYNMLAEYPGKVTIKIDGIAASAASVIAMAGDEVLVSPVSMLMIHNPATMAMGDVYEMKKAAAMLAEVKESIINAYERKTGLARTKISKLMDDETWMDAGKAIELGFADSLMNRKDEQKDTGMDVSDSMLFSSRKVMNSFVNKLKSERKDQVSSASLLKRLDLMKTWRDDNE